jgi:hypothetical protein
MADETTLRLSHSAVEDYAQCGEKYRLRRVARVPQVPGWALVGGSAFHATTEHLDNLDFGYDDGGTGSFEEAFEAEQTDRVESTGVLPDEWAASGRASKEYPNKEDREFWLKNGPKWVLQYRRFLAASPWQVWLTPDGEPAIELELEWFLEDIPVKGYIDRIYENVVTGALLIVDLKTGAREPMGTKQLVTYHNGLRALWKEQGWHSEAPRYGSYYMARSGLLTSPEVVADLDDGRLEFDYSNARKGIEAGIFLPSKSTLCGSCNVRAYCREFGGEHAYRELPYEAAA